MTRRAIFWCGAVTEVGGPYFSEGVGRYLGDLAVSVNDIHLALQACAALGIDKENISVFACPDIARKMPSGLDIRAARYEALDGMTKGIGAATTPGDALLFMATNHGLEGGLHAEPIEVDELLFNGTAQDQVLGPAQLEALLDRILGQQILLIGACHAGAYLSIGQPQRRAVYAACAMHERIKYLRNPERTPFLTRMLEEWTGAGRTPTTGPASNLVSAWAVIGGEAFPGRGNHPVSVALAGSAIWI